MNDYNTSTAQQYLARRDAEYQRIRSRSQVESRESERQPAATMIDATTGRQVRVVAPAGATVKEIKKEPHTMTTANEKQAYIEAFGRLVAAERTAHPKLTRQQAVANVARREPNLHERYLESLPAIGPRLGSKNRR